MSAFDDEQFKQCWGQTEVIRQYNNSLYTFGDTKLPYVFAAEHQQYRDRVIVRRGVVLIDKPHIVLPPQYAGPHFEEGFDHADAMPAQAAYLFRSMGLPFSKVTNKPIAKENIEYGSLVDVLTRLEEELDQLENSETGLIKGSAEGADVSIMRYAIGLIIKSGPDNVAEFFDHLRRQRGNPIGSNERITNEDINRLFE